LCDAIFDLRYFIFERGTPYMADRSAARLVEIRLVELKRVDDSYFQDYAKVHERLERRLDKEPRPLSAETVSIVADEIVAWLATLAAKNVPYERLSHILRVGLGHLCAELIVVNPHLPQEEVAIRAYAELQRRGWDLATYDPEVAQSASKRMQSLEAARSKARSQTKKPSSSAKAGSDRKVIGNPKIAAAKATKVTPAKKEALMALEKKSSPAKATKPAAKKAVAKKATAKKPAAKKVAAKKPAVKKAVKKVAAKKPAAKKAVKKVAAKKPAVKKAVKKVAAKKPAAKKAVKKVVAKKPAVKKVVAKKAAAKKPAAKKPAAKKAASKPAVEPKPASIFSPFEEKKPEVI
jgi:hypothetical protein